MTIAGDGSGGRSSSATRTAGSIPLMRGPATRELDDARRSARGDAPHRFVRRARRPGVRAGGVVGGDPLDRSGVRVLHVPRQHHRRPAARRVDRVEDLSGGRAEEDRHHRGGHRHVRSVRRGRVVGAHHRCRARRAVRHDRRQLLASRHRHERRRDGARSQDRPHRLDASDHARRRLQLGVRRPRPELPGGDGPDFDFGSSAILVRPPAAATCWSRGRSRAWSMASTRRSRARCCGRRASAPAAPTAACSGAWRATAATSTRRCPTSGGSRAASAAPRPIGNAPLHPQQGGGLTALDVLDGAKAWVAPGTPCAPPRPGCSPAQPAAVTAIAGAVLSGAMDGHLRAFSAVDGRLLWDVDTAKSYDTVNGVPGHGRVARRRRSRSSPAAWCS